MHFLPFVSAILATAVLVTSEPSAQYNTFEIAALNEDTSSTDISNDGNLAGNSPSPTPTETGVPGAVEEQSPTAGRRVAPQPISPEEANPNSRQKIPPSRQQDSLPPNRQQREQNSYPDGSTRIPPGYRGNQHCREYGGCPFECHTDCVCWEWCKGTQCNLAVSGEQALTSAQISCDPSAGEKFIGKVCRPYCANWCEDIKSQIVQALSSDQEQKAFLSRPRECDKNYYMCPNDPNPSGLDCLKPTNPLDPGLGGQSGSSGSYGNQQPPNFSPQPGAYGKELDKTNAPGITEFSLDDS